MVKKFKSFHALDSYLAGTSGSEVLGDIVNLEKKASSWQDKSLRTREKIQNRILEWWNQRDKRDERPNILSHRPSYVLTYLLKKEIAKKEKLRKVI